VALGLASVAKATIFWLIASACVGSALGLLGFVVRYRTAAESAMAAGVVAAALSSGGARMVIGGYWNRVIDHSWIAPAVSMLTIVLGVSIGGLMRWKRHDGHWVLFLLSTVVIGALCIAMWGITLAVVQHGR
jgi:hypothetical protein